MALSSLFREFYIGPEQIEKFADAIEESYQDSLTRDMSFLNRDIFMTKEEFEEFNREWRKAHGLDVQGD